MTYNAIANNAVRAGLTALASIALFSSIPASAQDHPEVRVSYTDLDLTTDAGRDTLNKRINSAVKRVCVLNDQPSGDYFGWQACRRYAYTGAHRQMRLAIAKADGRKTGIAANLAVGGQTVGMR